MKIKLLSDLHNEMQNKNGDYVVFKYESQGTEHEEILILAGDIGTLKASEIDHTMFDFIDELSDIFKHVILVTGNHEYYGSLYNKVNEMLLTGTYAKSFERLGWKDNVHFLQKDSVEIDGVTFIGSTLWTDFDNHNPLTMHDARTWMNDYKKITINDKGIYRKLQPFDTLSFHYEQRDFIFKELERLKGQKVVVCTHHLPSFQSIGECYAGNPLNGAYASNLDDLIIEHGPILWVHGHTHQNHDYMIGNTRIVSNPRGYFDENPRFDQHLTLEI